MLLSSGLSDTAISKDTGLTTKFVKRVRERDDYEPGGKKLYVLYAYLKGQMVTMSARSHAK